MMGIKTGIAWTDHTWNPWRGCRKVSAGCRNCYMFREQIRYGKDPGKIVRAASKTFLSPYHWDHQLTNEAINESLENLPGPNKAVKSPDRELVFTCSWSDFFIEDADAWRPDAWEIIQNTPNLIYQILTKRIDNVPSRLPADWPLPNVWLGVTVEDQNAVARIAALAKIQAAKRFISAEPLLSAIDFGCTCWLSLNTGPNNECEKCGKPRWFNYAFDWMIVGGESGPGARRPCLSWILDIRDQCDRVKIPLFFKQWGGTKKIDGVYGGNELDGKTYLEIPGRGDE